MKPSEFAFAVISVIPSVIVFVELFLRLHVTDAVRTVKRNAIKSFGVISSRRISDHWKEKVLLRYALLIFGASLRSLTHLAILIASFSAVFCLAGLLFHEDLNEVWNQFLSLKTQTAALVIGIIYAVLRKRLISERSPDDYSVMSKMLHHLALDSSIIKKVAFDVDCQVSRFRRAPSQAVKPVFVAGLARSGTTILLEALYSTGVFATLTYRDMPFVTAPILWKFITSGNRRQSDLRERAHGDRLEINYDSPEAFEEVFWLTFSNGDYAKDNYLEQQNIDEEVIQNYRQFVYNVIAGSGKRSQVRYLAKNNNNLLRIHFLKEAFPDGAIVVPFRNPLDHAKSLQNQHKRFLRIHSEDAFSLQYMNWLGHFEFGLNFKPFKFSEEAVLQYQGEPETLEYWLRYWKCVYEHVLSSSIPDILLFDYDAFCNKPAEVLHGVADSLSLDISLTQRFQERVKGATRYEGVHVDQQLLDSADKVHRQLISRSRRL